MSRRLVIALTVVGIAALVLFAAFAIVMTQGMGSWTGGSKVLLGMMIAGTLLTGGLTGVLMWLAFYSSRKGYDEPFRLGEPSDHDDRDGAG
jgi:cation transporter-like permease